MAVWTPRRQRLFRSSLKRHWTQPMLPCFSSTKNCCRGPTALENWQFARTRISRINPSMHLSSVLLPAPLGPMMPTNSPRAMRNDTERRRLERCGDGGIGQADVFGLRKTLVGEPVDSALLQVLLHGDDLGHLLEEPRVDLCRPMQLSCRHSHPQCVRDVP